MRAYNVLWERTFKKGTVRQVGTGRKTKRLLEGSVLLSLCENLMWVSECVGEGRKGKLVDTVAPVAPWPYLQIHFLQ